MEIRHGTCDVKCYFVIEDGGRPGNQLDEMHWYFMLPRTDGVQAWYMWCHVLLHHWGRRGGPSDQPDESHWYFMLLKTDGDQAWYLWSDNHDECQSFIMQPPYITLAGISGTNTLLNYFTCYSCREDINVKSNAAKDIAIRCLLYDIDGWHFGGNSDARLNQMDNHPGTP